MKPFVDINFSVTDIVSAVHIRNAEGSLHIPGDNYNKIIYISGGSFECEFSKNIEEKHLLFIAKATDVSLKIKEPLNAYIIGFINHENIEIKPVYYKVKSADIFENLFRSIHTAWTRKGLYFMTKCKQWLYEIIFRIKKDCEEAYVPDHNAIRLKPALDYINENYLNETISTVTLAKMCNMGETRFRYIFKMTTGNTPRNYINTLKIQYASELIKSKSYKNINEVAIASGFSDLSYFSRIFLKIYGIRPRTFIKMIED